MTAKINRQLAKRQIVERITANLKVPPRQWQQWGFEKTHKFNADCLYVFGAQSHTLPKLVAAAKSLACAMEIPVSTFAPEEVLVAV